MDTKHVLDELLAQYEESPGVPAGLDAEEAELVRRVMGAGSDGVAAREKGTERSVGQIVYSH